jgi:glycosyltransferase involved in cell wall biosynthesis
MGLEKGIHLVRQALLRGGFENLEFVYVDHSLPFGTEQTTSYGTTPVRVLGKFPASRVADLYAQFDVLVAPSIWPESFGLVTREALSLGLWVIASNLGAMGEDVVEGENGFVIPVDTPDGLIDAFSKVDADPGRYKQPPEIRPKIRTAKDQARDMAAIYLDYAKKG